MTVCRRQTHSYWVTATQRSFKSAVSSANSNGLVVNGVKVSQSEVCYCGPWVSVMLKAVMCLPSDPSLCFPQKSPLCSLPFDPNRHPAKNRHTHFQLHTRILSPQRFINSKLRAPYQLGCYFNKRVSPNPLAINSIFLLNETKKKKHNVYKCLWRI